MILFRTIFPPLSLLFILGFIHPTIYGQNIPSGSIAKTKALLTNAPWKTERIHPGLVWKYHHFSALFGSRQSINVLEIDLNNPSLQIQIAYRDTALLPTSELATQAGALAAVNGNFFHTEEGGSVCFLKIDNQISIILYY